jgi:DNA-directed RNA polymerase specialized sigma24 family protein
MSSGMADAQLRPFVDAYYARLYAFFYSQSLQRHLAEALTNAVILVLIASGHDAAQSSPAEVFRVAVDFTVSTSRAGPIPPRPRTRAESALVTLDDQTRLVLSLVFDAQLSSRDAATATGISEQNVKRLLLAGARAMDDALGKPDEYGRRVAGS